MIRDIGGLLSRGREAMDMLMTDTCRITVRGEGEPVFDEDTLQYTYPDEVEVYGPATAPLYGKCRFQIKADINSNIVETGGGDREATYSTSMLQIPSESATDIPVDSVVYSLTSPHSPALPGRQFNIHGEIGHKSQHVYRRFRLREVVA